MTMNRLSYGTKSAAGGGLQPVAQAALARTCRSRSRLIKLVIQDIRPITQTQIADDLQRVLGSWGRLRAKKPGNDRPWRRFGRAQTAEHLFDCRLKIFDLFKQPGILYLHGVIAHLEDFAALKDEILLDVAGIREEAKRLFNQRSGRRQVNSVQERRETLNSRCIATHQRDVVRRVPNERPAWPRITGKKQLVDDGDIVVPFGNPGDRVRLRLHI